MTTDALSCAIQYASVGLRVIPIPKGAARPSHEAWQDVATTDRKTIERWFTGKGIGVGIVLGLLDDLAATPTYVFAIDIDGASHDVDGQSTWEDFCSDNDWTEPDTAEQITGGGGRHLLFTSPVEIRNGDSRNFAQYGPGIDVRGAGGFITAEPTLHHKTGVRYQWTEGQEPHAGITPAPQWLIDFMLARPERRERPTSHVAPTGRPGDDWGASVTWRQLLEGDGWTWSHADRNGVDYWCRPGKTPRDGHSASVGYAGSDSIKVFTSGVPNLVQEEAYSKLGYLAATRFGGDHSAAASWCRREGFGQAVEAMDLDSMTVGKMEVQVNADPLASPAANATNVAPPTLVDVWPVATVEQIDAILAGNYEPPTPEILWKTDGTALLYPGKVHSLGGEPGGGKTWVALLAAAQEITNGGIVVLLDYEDRLDTAVRRLINLGCDADHIRRNLRYVTPMAARSDGHLPANVLESVDGATLAIVDSMGEALAHGGLEQNDDGDVADWMSKVAKRLADGGAAVLILDHVVKDGEARNRYNIGSQRKLAAIDGAAYQLIVQTAATREAVGRATIRCSKDRQGYYQHGTIVADVTLTPDGDAMIITVEPPKNVTESGETLLTGYMEKISKFLESGDPMSGRAVIGSIDGKTDHKRTALRQLIEGGFVETESGDRGAVIHRSIRPYREFDELTAPTAPHRAPTAPGRTAPDHQNRPRPAPLGLHRGAVTVDVGDPDDTLEINSTAPHQYEDDGIPLSSLI